jgi:predicted membrane chloride channel (bestrophin family)
VDTHTHSDFGSSTTSNPAGATITNANSNQDQSENKKVLLIQLARDLQALSILRPAIPSADFSAPRALISDGSSYTRLWNHDIWNFHTLQSPHKRYYRHVRKWRFSTTAQKVLPAVLLAGLWSFLVAMLGVAVGHWGGTGSKDAFAKACSGIATATSALSAPLALLLTLRTNAALARLQEARQAWGKLVLAARTLSAELRLYIFPYYPRAAVLAARHLAIYGWILKSYMRGEDRNSEVFQAMLDDESRMWLVRHPRATWGIPLRLRQILAAVAVSSAEQESPDATNGWSLQQLQQQHHLAQMEESIAKLESVAGICERILGSPIPPTYSRHLSRILTIWLMAFPLASMAMAVVASLSSTVMMARCVPIVVMSTILVSYGLIGLDEIGMEIEHPFPLLPLQQLAGSVQNSVGMQFLDHECCFVASDKDAESSSRNYSVSVLPTVPL